MTELSINGKPVALKEGLSIKITVANPFFTDSDSFSYDFEIPVTDARNSDIFGQLNRMDSNKEPDEYAARLTVDNVVLLDGSAVVTAVTDSSVKVQLLGDRTAYNYGSATDGIYVDELSLGAIRTEDVTAPGAGGSGGNGSWGSTSGDRNPGSTGDTGTDTAPEGVTYHDPEGRWVRYPVMNTNTDRIANDYLFYQDKSGTVHYGMVNVRPDPAAHETDSRMSYRTIQPKLWWICQLVAEATGCTLSKEDNGMYTDTFLRKIFIANTVPNCPVAYVLPHWTVAEFWQYVREAFGVVAHKSGDTMKLVPRSAFYADDSTIQSIERVIDEYSCDMDDEEAADVSTSNVAFASFEHDPCDLLDSSVTEVANIDESHASLMELRFWWSTLSDQQKAGYKGTIFKCRDGREYIYFSERFERPALVQVNQFAPRVTDSGRDASEISLKFVPCSYHEHQIDVACYVDQRGGGYYVYASEKAPGTHDILARPDRDQYRYVAPSLEDIIDGEDSGPETKDDVAYIALEGGMVAAVAKAGDAPGEWLTVDYPDPSLRERWLCYEGGDVSCEHRGDSLGLLLHKGSHNLGENALGGRVSIYTKAKMCVRFIQDTIPDPTHLFNIRNRLYACERLEVTVDSEGRQPVITGYFFPAFL